MSKTVNSLLLRLLIVASLGLFSGCAAPRHALYSHPEFNPQEVAQITVLPVVDIRPDKKLKFKDSWVQNIAKSMLKSSKYTPLVVTDTVAVATITEAELRNPDAEFVKGLYPPEPRWVMLFVLNDVSRELTFGSTGNAEMECYLFDKEKGILVWHDKAVGRVGQGGLLGMMFIGTMSGDAIRVATAEMLGIFPKRQKLKA